MNLCVIIPTLNEAETLPRLLTPLRAGGVSEILVVDGGSRDGTPDIARKFGVTCLPSTRGRAAQLNRGAAAARGDWLWFLHADTALSADWHEQLRRAMEDPAVVGGGFRSVIDAPGAGYRFLDAWGWLRTRSQRSFYGDQGIFVRRDLFERLGGFAEIPVCEDAEFSRRMWRAGRVAILPGPLRTSARRWQRHGWWRTVFQHSCLVLTHSPILPFFRSLVPVVIFAKLPVPGEVKTRLVPPLTQQEAADLALKLLRETVATVRRLNGVQPIVAVWPPDGLARMRELLSMPVRLIPQEDGGFGKRLADIFNKLHEEGAKGTIILGADHPNLPAGYLKQAVKLLSNGKDRIVLGPTEDGGYYLIGLTRPHPELFHNIPFSSPDVLKATRERAKTAGLPVALLPPWYDLDRPEDLSRYNSSP